MPVVTVRGADQIVFAQCFQHGAAGRFLTDVDMIMADEPPLLEEFDHGLFEMTYHQHALEDRQAGSAIESGHCLPFCKSHFLPRTSAAASRASRSAPGSVSGSRGFLYGVRTSGGAGGGARARGVPGGASQSNACSVTVAAISPVMPYCR